MTGGRKQKKMGEDISEEQHIYQVLLEELMLSGTRLPQDKINAAIKAAQHFVALEVDVRFMENQTMDHSG
jgi:hypothetical protein